MLRTNLKKKEDFYILGLLITSWVLITLPEFIYIKDIYSVTHYRANTMFKLTYQAFVMTYLSSGYIAIRTIEGLKKPYQKILLALFYSFIFTSIMYYPFKATNSYYGDLKVYKDLSGETWLRDKNPDTFAAISWLRENVEGQPTILEAPGDSYTEYNSISSYTGLPTLSGWYVHEWLWRGSPDIPQERVTDINLIYTSQDESLTKVLLQKYDIKYVIVSSFEKEKFPELFEEKFGRIGKVVFSTPTTTIYRVN